MTTVTPASADDVVAAMRQHARVVPHGALTKTPLVGGAADAVRIDMSRLSGVSEYDPSEYTFTAFAGTPLREIEALLGQHGQYMPFDPPLVEDGATIGGTLAAGVNGPGRLRYGGLRDFVIGVRLVDGTGTLVMGGGKVVKNAAGFDLPKLMVGSMGRLGVIVEMSFKVFPAPQARRTLRVSCRDIGDAIACVAELGRTPLEVEALELEPPGTLMIGVAGADVGLDAHARRIGELMRRPYEVVDRSTAGAYWTRLRRLAWAGTGQRLVKVPLTLRRLPAFEATAAQQDLPRRYGAAGNVAWITWPDDRMLSELDLGGLSGVAVRGSLLPGESPLVGPAPGPAAFEDHVKHALDPQLRLPALR